MIQTIKVKIQLLISPIELCTFESGLPYSQPTLTFSHPRGNADRHFSLIDCWSLVNVTVKSANKQHQPS